MEKYFANYNQSLALKELGYDEPCFGWYEHNGNFYYCYQEGLVPPSPSKKLIKGCCLSPLKSQVFEWFRDKHNLISCVRTISYGCAIDEQEFYYEIVSVRGVESYEIYNKYEEAESACINKLIEIVENNLDK